MIGKLVRESQTVARLRAAGYEVISYSSVYRGTSMPEADRYIVLTGGMSEFERVFWSMVILPFRGLPLVAEVPGLDPYEDHATRITGTLDHLPTTRESGAPVFVFDAEGEPVRPDYSFRYADADMLVPEYLSREEYIDGYVAQLQYFNRRLLETVREIQAASPDPCIIVIQSDHGARLQLQWEDPDPEAMVEAFAILNAYQVPAEIEAQIYDEISPVNTFRLILNYCLGLQMPLLDDRSFFSTWSRPYDFVDVTGLARGDDDPPTHARLTQSD